MFKLYDADKNVEGLTDFGETYCRNERRGYVCTMPKDHTGKHYAGVSPTVAVAEWDNDGD